MRAILFTLLLVPCAAAVSATVYKWVDQNGVTHYSDQPRPGAEEVKVQAPTSYSAPPTSNRSTSNDIARATAPTGPQYSSCEIASPSNEEVFMNTTTVTGSIRLSPSLLSGHRLKVALDGKPIDGVGSSSTSFTIDPVYRGTHVLNVVVEDGTGAVVCQSQGVTIHVRQPSVANPQAPVNRRR
jgi:hypothetical protein